MSHAATLNPSTFAPATRSAAAVSSAPVTEWLAFKLGSEDYGVDILRVQEIRSYEAPTHIANAPSSVLGVLDLRGVIVPVVDLRMHLNFSDVHYDSNTVIIVLSLPGRVVGMVVDSVSDVMGLTQKQMRPAPEFSARLDSGHVLAIGAIDSRMLILIDIERVMSSPALGLMDA